jgi:hypothetical protein
LSIPMRTGKIEFDSVSLGSCEDSSLVGIDSIFYSESLFAVGSRLKSKLLPSNTGLSASELPASKLTFY